MIYDIVKEVSILHCKNFAYLLLARDSIVFVAQLWIHEMYVCYIYVCTYV